MIRSIAAISASLAIAAGAFGAHGASTPEAAEWLRIGGTYQLIHAVAVFAAGSDRRCASALWLMLAGSLLFAGTLYAMALGAPRWLGAVTPIGGAAMIVSWLWIARLMALRRF